jgi:cytochrome c oxidase subunit 2
MVGAAMTRRAALLLFLPVGGCVGIQSPLTPTGDQATALHQLLLLMGAVCGAVYLIVLAALGWSLWRARASIRTADEQATDDGRLNRGLWVAAGLIVVGLTVLIIGSFIADRAIFQSRSQEVLEVRVTGHQWWWRVEYRDPATGGWIETANEIHLPRGRTARVLLGSADVIHSFWVPNLAGKIDMIPGRRNVVDLTPQVEGWFRGQCAEFCGPQHAHMAFDVKVENPAAFDAWLAAQRANAAVPADPAAARGQTVFAGPCAECHVVRGTGATGRAGPDLTHFGSRRSIAAGTLTMSRGGVQGWIAQPQALKPGTSMPTVSLTPADADAVSHYLLTLK